MVQHHFAAEDDGAGVDLVLSGVLGRGADAAHAGGGRVASIVEGTLGKFHDVAFVHERDAIALVRNCVLDGGAHDALSAFLGYRLDADAGGFCGKRIFFACLGNGSAKSALNLSHSSLPFSNSMPA